MTSLPRYVALQYEGQNPYLLQCLSSQVMGWSSSIWILDLSRYQGYWCEQLNHWNMDVKTFLQKILAANLRNVHGDVVAAVGDHPWTVILLLLWMLRTKRIGVWWSHPETQARYVSWQEWRLAVTSLSHHWQQAWLKGTRRSRFNQALSRFFLLTERLNLRAPADLKQLHYEGVRRRFGQALAEIWHWTCWQAPEPLNLELEFPWQDYNFPAPPQVLRHFIEDSVWSWDQIEPYLQLDTDQLAQTLPSGLECRVTRLNWQWIFEDDSILNFPIMFRSPHALIRELGEQNTVKLQAQYAFRSAIKDWQKTGRLFGRLEGLLLKQWTLVLSDYLVLPQVWFDLFERQAGPQKDWQTLAQLNNECPVGLQRFSWSSDWLPEDSFQETTWEQMNEEPTKLSLKSELEAVARQRPLFLLKQAQRVRAAQPIKSIFMESTMHKWWMQSSPVLERQYYKWIDQRHRAWWVWDDEQGQQWVQGVYG